MDKSTDRSHVPAGATERALLLAGESSFARPRVTLSALGLVVVAAGLGLLRLELRTDGHALVPREDPAVLTAERVRADFDLRDPILLYLETEVPGDIFDIDTLARVQGLSEALAALPDIEAGKLMSLASEARPRVYTGTLDFRRLLEPLPDTPERMQNLRDDLDAIAILDGTLVTEDRRGTALIVGAPASRSRFPDGVDRALLARELEEAVRRFETPGERFRIVGAPLAEVLLGEHILADLLRLVPPAMLLVALVVWASCRRLWGSLLALAEVGSCLVFTFGIMGWLGVPVYLTTGVLPVILVSIGIADELHVLLHYQCVLGTGGDAEVEGAVRRTLRAMVRPVSLTSLTTGVGFLSFAFASIEPVAAFGIFAALGIFFCWVFTLLATPALLGLLGAARICRTSGPLPAGLRVARGYAALIDHPKAVLAALACVSAVLLLGLFGLRVQDSWIDGFAPDSAFRLATDHVDQRLHGTHQLLVELGFEERESWPEVWGGRRGPFLDAAVLGAVGRFEQALRALPGVGGALGPHTHLASVNFLFLAQGEGTRSIPDRAGRIANLIDRFDGARGVERRREVIHDDLHRGIVQVLVRGANYRDTEMIMQGARAAAAEHLAPKGGTIAFAGDLAVSQAMIPAIVRNQLGSLILAIFGGFLCLALVLRSLRGALIALAPTAAAVLWCFGAMGWTATPIGVATSTFAAITLGIGVDYTIHWLERLRRAPAAPLAERAARAGREAAPAIAADAAAVALGFGLLVASQVPATARLGAVVAVGLPAAALLTLVGLPALLCSLATRFDVDGWIGAPSRTRLHSR